MRLFNFICLSVKSTIIKALWKRNAWVISSPGLPIRNSSRFICSVIWTDCFRKKRFIASSIIIGLIGFQTCWVIKPFSNRLNNLESSFRIISRQFLDALTVARPVESDYLIDSFPVMLAKSGFARRACVAREFASIGYCAAKRLHFHGVRLHLLAARRAGFLPTPFEVWFRAGNVHDLVAFKERDIRFPNGASFGDKAFCDSALKNWLKEQNVRLFVPLKKPKGKEQSRIRQKIFTTCQQISSADWIVFQMAQ